MFDYGDLGELDAEATAAAVAGWYHLSVESGTRVLGLAAHWADLHNGEALNSLNSWGHTTQRGAQRARLVGGAGTPSVMEFAAAEFALLIQRSTTSAWNLIGDALDLRHRLPLLWARVCAGDVEAWKARKVAQATHHLCEEAARYVDQAVAGSITSLPWTRFDTLLEAKIIAADPAGAEARARIQAAERFVRASSANEHGLKFLIAKANAGDVIWFMAMVNRIADILLLDGDTDSADVRRSKAIGILAQPARALQLLWDHQHNIDSHNNHEPDHTNEDPAEDPDHKDPDHANDPANEDPEHKTVLIRAPMLNPAKLGPQVVLYIHLSQQALTGQDGEVARFEDVGPVTIEQVRQFLGNGDCQIRIQPVIDLAEVKPVDGYEIPDRIREALHLRNPADIFPYGTNTSRRQDFDHTIPYLSPDKGGPPGQTSMNNLGPLSRFLHRLKTHSRWRLRQPSPGVYLWRSPLGWVCLVDNTGTHSFGNTPFAQTIWHAANHPNDPVPCYEDTESALTHAS